MQTATIPAHLQQNDVRLAKQIEQARAEQEAQRLAERARFIAEETVKRYDKWLASMRERFRSEATAEFDANRPPVTFEVAAVPYVRREMGNERSDNPERQASLDAMQAERIAALAAIATPRPMPDRSTIGRPLGGAPLVNGVDGLVPMTTALDGHFRSGAR